MAINLPEIKKRLSTLLKDPDLVEPYLLRYGADIKIENIKKLKSSMSSDMTKPYEDKDTPGEDPLYESKVECPICGLKGITSFQLRSKALAVTENLFLIPSYTPTQGFRHVNYTYLYITVCPRCLFASPDKRDFASKDPKTEKPIPSKLSSNAIMLLQEEMGKRNLIMKSVSDYENYFSRPRSPAAAIKSLRLAGTTADAEIHFSLPYGYYKKGTYLLRTAGILREFRRHNTKEIQSALDAYEEAFKTSNCPSEEIEMRVLYLIIALNIFFKRFKKANSYLAMFSTLKNRREAEMRSDPSLSAQAINKWLEKARFVWEDRERDDLFEGI
ncbi:MAG: DUF2225 domain-containing protein [Chitinivibrionales bacterium]